MDGSLETTAPADVLRMLARNAATGTLHLDTPYGRGRVVVSDGDVVGAWSPAHGARLGDRLVGAGHLSRADLARILARQDHATSPRLGALLVDERLVSRDAVRLFVQEQILDALFEIVGWRAGSYSFDTSVFDSAGDEIPVTIPMAVALGEVDRRRRDWRHLQELVPSLAAVPHATHSTDVSGALEADESAVLAHVDGSRTIRDLAVELGYGSFETARIVYGLASAGMIEVLAPSDDTNLPPATPSSAPPRPTTDPASVTDPGMAVGDATALNEPTTDLDGARTISLSRSQPARDANIAELLRELSQLAREPAQPAAEKPARRPVGDTESTDDDRSRRRRFGRGT